MLRTRIEAADQRLKKLDLGERIKQNRQGPQELKKINQETTGLG